MVTGLYGSDVGLPPIRTQVVSTIHNAAADCETLRDVVGQPANVVSSLAMSLCGLALVFLARNWSRGDWSEADWSEADWSEADWSEADWSEADWSEADREKSLRLVGFALLATGIGSVAFHGPGGWLAYVLHDVTITALPLAAAAAMESERRRQNLSRLFWVPMVIAVIARAVSVDLHYPVTAMAFAWFAVAVYQRAKLGLVSGRWLGAAGICLILARVIFQLSRTGQVLCTPDSLIQGHAVWHLLIGLGVVLVAKGLLMLPGDHSPRDNLAATQRSKS